MRSLMLLKFDWLNLKVRIGRTKPFVFVHCYHADRNRWVAAVSAVGYFDLPPLKQSSKSTTVDLSLVRDLRHYLDNYLHCDLQGY